LLSLVSKEKVNSDKTQNQSSKYEFHQIVPRLLTEVEEEEEEERSSEVNGPKAAGVPGCLVCIFMILIGLGLCLHESH